jgi:hypothetical protein
MGDKVKAEDVSDGFKGLYAAWLHARALYQSPIPASEPDPDALLEERSEAVDEAARQLLVMPAGLGHQVWLKWEVLEDFVDLDARDGMASDRRAIVALACVKADLVHFGFGK